MIPCLVFVLSCVLVRAAYCPLMTILPAYASYRALNANRQLYVVKNLIKGVMLAALVLVGAAVLSRPVWDDALVGSLGSMYCSNDFVGLLYVKRLPWTTVCHHVACICMLVVTWTIQFDTTLGRLIVWYTFCSALAFPVNLYLGWRHVRPSPLLKKVARVTYTLTCAVNWSVQYILFEWSWGTGIYAAALLPIMWDDIVLIRFLWRP